MGAKPMTWLDNILTWIITIGVLSGLGITVLFYFTEWGHDDD